MLVPAEPWGCEKAHRAEYRGYAGSRGDTAQNQQLDRECGGEHRQSTEERLDLEQGHAALPFCPSRFCWR